MKKIIFKTLNKFGFTIKKKYNLDEKDIAFLHIGKTGGTQIMNIFSKLNKFNLKVIKHSHEVRLSDISIKNEYFFSIRKPEKRYMSGFYSRLRKGMPRIYVEWTEDEDYAFKSFSDANELAESIFLKNDKGKKARIAMTGIGHINSNQYDCFQNFSFLDKRPPLFIIRQEYFQSDMKTLFDILNINLNVNDLIENDPKVSHSNDYANIKPLSDLAIKNLNNWYARDNLFYKLCEDWIDKKKTIAK